MRTPITQSVAWKRLQDDLGEKSYLRTGKGYQFLAIEKRTGSYLYCPYGPNATSEESFHEALKALQSLGGELNATFIRIEPFQAREAEYLPHTAIKSKDLNPKETWLLDLTGTDEGLKQKLPSRLLRYYKSAAKKGITIETSRDPEDIKYLLNLQRALAKEKGISTFSEYYLQTELKQPFATLYLVKQNQQVLAAGLVFDDEDTRYNLQGAQSDEGRKQHATGILTIQLILDAKKKGLKTFDFWGIAPEGASKDHPWIGFTNFKKTFAGYQYNHAGTYDLVLKPAKYKLYQAARRLRSKF